MTTPFDFTDQNVVVVGGTSGINRGIAMHFSAAGANVAVASRSQHKVDDTVTALGKQGKAMGFAADVRDYAAVEAGFNQVADTWGAIDVVVSGAAGNFPAMASTLSPNGFKSVVDIDLLGTYHDGTGACQCCKSRCGYGDSVFGPGVGHRRHSRQ